MDYAKIKNSLTSLKILYIEDEVYLSNYLEEFLTKLGAIVYASQTAEEGFKLFQKHNPDVIISDINLPQMNGIDFITKIREENKQVRIIITSAYTDSKFTLQAVELDITRYLVKPITGQKLLETFEKAIEEMKQYQSNDQNDIDLGNGYRFDKKGQQLYLHNEPILLRRKELMLLMFFIKNRNNIITYDMLENNIWQENIMTLDAIRSQIKNLRNKTYKDIVTNISGVGYKLFS